MLNLKIAPITGVLLFLTFCHPKKNALAETDKLKFNTTDASELFFKNVRKSSYEEDEMKAAGMNVYRSADLKDLVLAPQLIVNWRNDQAFILFTGDILSDKDELTFFVGDKNADSITFDASSQRNHATLAAEIYNAILRDELVNIEYSDSVMVFFISESQREAFRRMFFDYLRLTEQR